MSYRSVYPEKNFGEFWITADKKKLSLEYVFNLLCLPSQYSTGLPPERYALVLRNSLCFGVFHNDKQIGFARVISDCSEFASLWDVFIDEPYRRQGIGQEVLKYLLNHPRLRGIYRWFLMTEDAHGLYQKFGFKTESYNPYVMMRVNAS